MVRLLTVREAAERLAVSTFTVYGLCDRGELPHVRASNAGSSPRTWPHSWPASEDAFTAVPASLAACRVIAHLEPVVRGGDPSRVEVASVLRQSDVFPAVARRALSIL